MIKQYKKTSFFKVLLVVLVLCFALPALAVWQDPPTGTPPDNCNPLTHEGCNPPVNVSSSAQVKRGFLDLGFLGLNALSGKAFSQMGINLEGKICSGVGAPTCQLVKNWLISSADTLHIFGQQKGAQKREVKIWDNLNVANTISSQFYEVCTAGGSCSPLTTGGTTVVANPAGTDGSNLNRIKIGTTNWNIPTGGTGALPNGSSNQTLYYSASGWAGSSMLTNNGTNIGINIANPTTDPAKRLNVVGGVYTTGPISAGSDICTRLGGANKCLSTLLPSGTIGQTLSFDGTSWKASSFLKNVSEDHINIGKSATVDNNIYISTEVTGPDYTYISGPRAKFDSGYIDLGVFGGVNMFPSASLLSTAKNTISPISSGVAELAIAGSGNTGSRKVSIYDNLNVNGNLNVTGTTTTNGLVVNQICNAAGACSPVTNLGGTSQWTTSSANPNNIYYNKAGGNVGIGLTTPTTPLEVNGVIKANRTGYTGQSLLLDGGDANTVRLKAVSVAGAEKPLSIENVSSEGTAGANNRIDFKLGTASTLATKMTIDSAKLNVNGSIMGTGLGITGLGTVSDSLAVGATSKVNSSLVKLDVKGFILARGSGARVSLGGGDGSDPASAPVWNIDNEGLTPGSTGRLRFYYSSNVNTPGTAKISFDKDGGLSLSSITTTGNILTRGFKLAPGEPTVLTCSSDGANVGLMKVIKNATANDTIQICLGTYANGKKTYSWKTVSVQ